MTLITIPSGTSYVEAKKLMHFFHLTNLARLELDFTEKRRDACKTSTKKSTFVDNCVAEVSVYNSAVSRLGIDLEGQDVTVTGTNEKNVAVHASKIWQTTIDRLAVRTCGCGEYAPLRGSSEGAAWGLWVIARVGGIGV